MHRREKFPASVPPYPPIQLWKHVDVSLRGYTTCASKPECDDTVCRFLQFDLFP